MQPNPTRPTGPDKSLLRLFTALAREGLDVSLDGRVYSVRLKDGHADDLPAEVLLPEGFAVEAKALRQLAGLAAVRHPAGGKVCRTCASPDFHPGDAGVAIGSIVETDGIVIPAAVGSDINCGMRLHVVDLPADRLLARRDELVELLKGDYFFGTRDLPMPTGAMKALFHEGLLGWLAALGESAPGALARSDLDQLSAELDRVHLGGALAGHARWAPEDLVPDSGHVRDGGMATIGGGNHFVELQVVEEVVDGALAHAWGVRPGQVAFMIHSGSRGVGKHVGAAWRDKARATWPKGHRHPDEGLFSLSLADHPELVAGYLEAEATAANYGFVNRLLLAELMRLRLRQIFGQGLAAPLVYDLPHNITLPAGASRWITRKGACPADAGQPVIIPGSMGAPSYLLVGRGNQAFLSSASHGAGRARSRFTMSNHSDHDEQALGLHGVDCITLREERRIEEAPAAYKPIGPVIDCQVEAGMIGVVARLRPLMTFKA
ncbi:MAG: RtcB family protein [Myxococcales bacterium]|nr:RtcB family protein [Myxococcales bacterium]